MTKKKEEIFILQEVVVRRRALQKKLGQSILAWQLFSVSIPDSACRKIQIAQAIAEEEAKLLSGVVKVRTKQLTKKQADNLLRRELE